MPTIKHDVREELVKRLSNELDYYKAIVDKFIKNYGSLEELENKIEEVPVDDHSMWEDNIEWRNAVEEVEKLESLLKELKY
ncbi:MAG: hypothetical protein ACOC5L_02980 [Halobacteriota archaeon]